MDETCSPGGYVVWVCKKERLNNLFMHYVYAILLSLYFSIGNAGIGLSGLFNLTNLISIIMKKIIAMSMISAMSVGLAAQGLVYPEAPRSATVDDYFGTKVLDPYRPLEDDTAAVTAQWVKAENTVTRGYLDAVPFRGAIHERLTRLNNYLKPGVPFKYYDGLYYYFENDGLRNQSVLYRTDRPGGTPEVFLDPNTLSADGTVALTGVYQSHDGRYTAYTISRSGSDWSEIYVMDTKTKKLLADHIEWAKFTDASWAGDGFFYSAYAKPEDGKEFSKANEYHSIYYHKMGTPQSEDRLIYRDSEHPLHFYLAQVPEDESVLMVYGAGAGIGSSMRLKKMADVWDASKPWVEVEPSQDYAINVFGVKNGKIYMTTSWNAPRLRVMTADIDAPRRDNWKELVPQADGVLSDIALADDDKMVLVYDKDASNQLWVYGLDGRPVREVKMPTFGSVGIYLPKKPSAEMFYTFTSFTYPTNIYRYNLDTDKSTLYKATKVPGVNFADYETEQVFYTSKDGTRVPMFLTYKKGLKRDGKNPVLLYGYGGFNITLNPSFSAQRMFWLENGGIYAMANLRGGGEYGEAWHLAGTKMQKQNVFDDFIAAAEYLIKQGWTSSEHIAIEGGSNGGLLVGAVINQRPDLFKVAIPHVGVMDMMRYHRFTIGWNWASDYGTSADSKEMAEYLLGYSPLHNIKSGVKYPAIMVLTADHDDRVVPAHSFKYAATLQAAETGDAPKLIRIDSKAGHGAGKPISKLIDENTDVYTFIFKNLGMTPVVK